MRALVNDGATASRQEQPCTTPEELAKAVGEMPRIRPPEPAFTASAGVPAHDLPAGHLRPPVGAIPAPRSPIAAPPPPLQSRTGKALKWAVSALLIAALGLGSWQLADALMNRGNNSDDTDTTQTQDDGDKGTPPRPPAADHHRRAPQDFDPLGRRSEQPGRRRPTTYDGRHVDGLADRDFYRGLRLRPPKPGVGVVLTSAGKVPVVSTVTVGFARGPPRSSCTPRLRTPPSEPPRLERKVGQQDLGHDGDPQAGQAGQDPVRPGLADRSCRCR